MVLSFGIVKRFLLLLGLLLGFYPAWVMAAKSPADSLLTELNQALARKKEYDGQRLNRIAVLTAAFASLERTDDTRFDLGVRIRG